MYETIGNHVVDIEYVCGDYLYYRTFPDEKEHRAKVTYSRDDGQSRNARTPADARLASAKIRLPDGNHTYNFYV